MIEPLGIGAAGILGVAAPWPFPPFLFLISLTSSTQSSVHAASTELFRRCALTSCDAWTPPAPPCHAAHLSSRQRPASTARTRLRTQLRHDDDHPAVRRNVRGTHSSTVPTAASATCRAPATPSAPHPSASASASRPLPRRERPAATPQAHGTH